MKTYTAQLLTYKPGAPDCGYVSAGEIVVEAATEEDAVAIASRYAREHALSLRRPELVPQGRIVEVKMQ